jgi:hypothetical protein
MWMHISETCWYGLDFELHRSSAKERNADGEVTVVFPKSKFPNEASREDLVMAVREYIQGRLTTRTEDLERVRRIVGWTEKTA